MAGDHDEIKYVVEITVGTKKQADNVLAELFDDPDPNIRMAVTWFPGGVAQNRVLVFVQDASTFNREKYGKMSGVVDVSDVGESSGWFDSFG